MDPLTITTSVLTLVTRSISAVQTCQAYAAKYQIADLSIAAIRTECASIRIALLQIQNLIAQSHGRNVQHQVEAYVLEEYETVLSACSLTFSLLSEKLESLGFNGLNERHESDVVSKLNFVWKGSTMESIRQSIRGQAIAITLLLTAFQSETTAQICETMKSQEVKHSLLNVSNDAKSLSILMRPSDLSTTGSLLGDEEFEFDDIIINSAAYRRVFKKQQNKSQVSAIEIRSQDVVSRVEKNRRNPWQILGRASRLASYIQVEAPASPLSSSAPRRSQSNVQPTVAPNKVTDLYTTNGQYIEGRVAEGLHEINIGMGGYVSAFRLSATFEPTRDPKARSWHTFRYKDYYSEGFIRTIDGGKDNQVSSLWDWSCTGRRQDDINRGDMIAVTALFTNGWALGRQLRFDANTWPGTGIMGRQPGLKLFPLSCVCLPQHWSRLAQLSPNDLATELTSWMEKRKEGRTVGWIKI